MPAFVILDLSIHAPEKMEEYRKLAPITVAAFDGRFVVRGGQITTLEGKWTTDRIVVIEFTSVEKAKEWWNSEQYAEAKVIRQQAAETKVIIVEGV